MLDLLLEIGMNNPHPFTVTGYEGQYAALDQFNSRSWASDIDVPVLVLAGDQDLIFSERSIKALAEAIPSATYYCFQECGHLPMMEYPEQFAEIVSRFVNAHT